MNKYKSPRPKRRTYEIDKQMKSFLSSMANKAMFEERKALYLRENRNARAGWSRAILIDMMESYGTHTYECEKQPVVENPVVSVRKAREPRDIIPTDKFGLIVRHQKNRCYLCGSNFSKRNTPTREHVKPVSLGGKNDFNVLAACKDCNAKKGNRMPYPCEAIYLAATYVKLAGIDRKRSRRRVSA